MIKAIIFDFNRTLYLPEIKKIPESSIELLKRLKDLGFVLALITIKENTKKEWIRKISRFFLIVKEVNQKTENDFLDILKELNLNKDDVLVVGDRVKIEIKIAKRLGLKTVWFRNGKFKDELPDIDEIPDYTISKLENILDLKM